MNNCQNQLNSENAANGGLWTDALRRLGRRKAAVVCFVVIAAYFSLAAVVHLAEIFDWKPAIIRYNQQVGTAYERPGLQHPFGTDMFGQSVLRKTLYGAKVSLTVALCASFISIIIGISLGAMAGYFRGFIDQAVTWVYSTLSSVPYILLILGFAVVLRNRSILGLRPSGAATACIAMGLTSWVGICRLVRGEVLKRAKSEYVLAAESYGCSSFRIILKHLMPNIFHIVIIDFCLRFVRFVHAEVVLSFLGLGEQSGCSWGMMISDARLELLRGVWWQMTAATAAILLISLALNVFGDALRDCLDPELRIQ